MIIAIRHVGLVVADLESSLMFWCDILGFRVVRRMNESGPHIDAMMGLKDVQVTTAKLAGPDGHLVEILHFHSHPDKPLWQGKPYSTGLTHIALTVENLDVAYERLQRAGVCFPAKPQLSPDGNVKIIYAQGPEGVLLELVEVIPS